ncbi:protein SCO1/2 [Modicisalibacter ilicicola DSM 19980]|uniref:Protein SCO1/2 n=1 Tax=Modicisalibacter ilicicola DSM 19980 TaxID=1121942 RepID=A0A1M5AFQ9_9GAMM|nr:SCO family protein [Halomonas ilicicola]SHF28954.1 protein SCO1/2 [Halomonas ilicicola DSM 19980]
MSHFSHVQRWVMALGAVALVIALVLTWVMLQRPGDGYEAPPGGPVTLPSTQGEFSLGDLGDDQVAVLFFGYTHCPDVCPLSMAVVRQTLARLDEQARQRVVPVLISVDPERDDLARLKEYVGYFGPRFIGATGSQAQLEEIAERYGVFWRKVDTDDSAMGYTVDHSASLFIVDNQGKILKQVVYSPVPQALTSALEQVLSAS